jgi:hypothetical protein
MLGGWWMDKKTWDQTLTDPANIYSDPKHGGYSSTVILRHSKMVT